MDAFAIFGLKRSLSVESGEIREFFREKSKIAHPDAGGDPEGFSLLQEAMSLLINPAARLRHWLEMEGIEGALRGSISSSLVNQFMEISAILQRADELIRERREASSQLAKAMTEARAQTCREELEGILEQLDREIEDRVDSFARIECGEIDGWEVARELAFLEKWQGQVKERFGELW